MTREEAFALVNNWTPNKNLVKHMVAVEAIMRALARYFCNQGEILEEEKNGNSCTELVEVWGLAGLLHDADYESYKDDTKKHPGKIFAELENRRADARIIDAIKSHAWGWREDLPEPKTKMEWSLYCCDELSGLIIACALVRPDRKLQSVTLESLQKKWGQKSFAAGVHREQIELCESKLDIQLNDFIQLTLSAMQGIHEELGL